MISNNPNESGVNPTNINKRTINHTGNPSNLVSNESNIGSIDLDCNNSGNGIINFYYIKSKNINKKIMHTFHDLKIQLPKEIDKQFILKSFEFKVAIKRGSEYGYLYLNPIQMVFIHDLENNTFCEDNFFRNGNKLNLLALFSSKTLENVMFMKVLLCHSKFFEYLELMNENIDDDSLYIKNNANSKVYNNNLEEIYQVVKNEFNKNEVIDSKLNCFFIFFYISQLVDQKACWFKEFYQPMIERSPYELDEDGDMCLIEEEENFLDDTIIFSPDENTPSPDQNNLNPPPTFYSNFIDCSNVYNKDFYNKVFEKPKKKPEKFTVFKNFFSGSSQPIPSQPLNPIEPPELITPTPPVSFEHSLSDLNQSISKEIYNNFLIVFEKYRDFFVDYYHKNNCHSIIFIEDVKKESKLYSDLIKQIKVNSGFKKKIVAEAFLQLGIYAKGEVNIPHEFKGLIRTYSGTSEEGLSVSYSTYAAPVLYQYKRDQLEFLSTNVPGKYEENTFNETPAVILGYAEDQAILLPLIADFEGNYTDEHQYGWNENLSGFKVDLQEDCLQLLQKNVDSSIKKKQDGTIFLSKENLKAFLEFLKLSYSNELYPIRIFKYAGKIKLSKQDDPMECDEIELIPIPAKLKEHSNIKIKEITKESENEPKQRIGIKRKEREAAFFEEVDQLICNPSKKIKLTKKLLRFRREGIAPSAKFNFNEIVSNPSQENKIEKEGTYLKSHQIADLNKQDDFNPSNFWDVTLNAVSQVTKKLDKFSAIKEIKPLNYPLFAQLVKYREQLTQKNTFISWIPSLKKYQRNAIKNIKIHNQLGISPLCSLHMGLGKTLVYIHEIAESIARKSSGVNIILTTSATRDKTVEELYLWLSEAKATAYLYYQLLSPATFDQIWEDKIIQFYNSKKLTRAQFWELKPLLMVAYKINSNNLTFKHKIMSVMIKGLNAHIEECSKRADVLSEIGLYEYFLTKTENSYIVNPDHGLDLRGSLFVIAGIANVFPFKRSPIKDKHAKNITPEECLRLINFSMDNIFKPSNPNKKKKEESFKNALKQKDAIVVLGYEGLSKLMQNNELKTLLYTTEHRGVTLDEASKVHTVSQPGKQKKNTSLNAFINSYAKELQKQGVLVRNITGTVHENNIEEGVELLNISNNNQAFPSETLSAIHKFQNKTVTSFIDLVFKENPKQLDLLKTRLVQSFAHQRALSSLLKDLVISKELKDEDVKAAWGDSVPTRNKELIQLEIPVANQALKAKIDEKLNSLFSTIKKSKSKSELSIISASAKLFGLYFDVNFTGKLNKNKNEQLKRSLESIRGKIETYQKDNQANIKMLQDHNLAYEQIEWNNTALQEHQCVLDILQNTRLRKLIDENPKLIIVRQFKIEDHILKPLLECITDKKVLLFGDSDHERADAIEALKKEDKAILILPQKSGSVGLNFGFIKTMIIFGQPWNPALLHQIEARVLRIDQGGDHTIVRVTRKDVHQDYMTINKRQKLKSKKFYFSSHLPLKEHLNIYIENLVQLTLRDYFLCGSEKPGYFHHDGVDYLIKSAQPNDLSIETMLKNKIAKIVENEITEEELLEAVNKVTPK